MFLQTGRLAKSSGRWYFAFRTSHIFDNFYSFVPQLVLSNFLPMWH